MRRTATAVVTGHWRRPLVRLRFVTALTIVVFAARFALVGADAALWPQGGETGAPVRVAEPGDTRPVRHVFRVVKERGDFVDVESLGAPAHGHCEDGPMGLHDLELGAEVPTDDARVCHELWLDGREPPGHLVLCFSHRDRRAVR